MAICVGQELCLTYVRALSLQENKNTVERRLGHRPDLDNLYVVDSSFFPSSGGTNPSLTIAANALRVGGVVNEQIG